MYCQKLLIQCLFILNVLCVSCRFLLSKLGKKNDTLAGRVDAHN